MLYKITRTQVYSGTLDMFRSNAYSDRNDRALVKTNLNCLDLFMQH